MTVRFSNNNAVMVLIAYIAVFLLFIFGCTREPSWKSLNDRIIKENNITLQTRNDIPETGFVSNLNPGEIINRKDLPVVELAPGVTGKMFWGKGCLVNWMTMEPDAEIQKEKLPGERIMVVWKGSVEQLISGNYVTMSSTPHKDFVYLLKGADNAMKAGRDGAEILEIYSPVRGDYVEKASGQVLPNQDKGMYHIAPSIPPNQVLNFYDVQFTTLSQQVIENSSAKSQTQKATYSRLISGQGFQCSFFNTDPGYISHLHAHPEEVLSIVLRSRVTKTIMDETTVMEEGDIVYLPSDMVHKESYGSKGYDGLDVFWPPRLDYDKKMNDRLSHYHAIIPEDTMPVLVHDGEKNEPYLNFTEGPAWMDGKLFFSNMWFAPDWSAGSPEKSNIICMERDDTFTIIKKNMQTNGLMPLGNGNLAVCDMFGHRIIEMKPNGNVVRTLAHEYNGVRLDGPNDLVIDAKGGIYFTDPQFTPGLDKTQPGKSVYYRNPGGKVLRVIDPGEFGMPNGILLSPDGKICYINNTRNMPVGNYVVAYDVNEDGTLSNKRLFAKLFLPSQVLDNEEVTSGADGMTIDVNGNIYVATLLGLQIFDKDGEFIGIVHLPIRPVSCVFGGDDMQTIYCTCATQIYSIKTNVKGLQYPLR